MGDHDPVHGYWPKCDRVPFPPATSRLYSGQSRGRVVAIAASYNSGTETPEGLIEELISLRLPEVNLFAHHHVSDNPIDPEKVVSDRDHLASDAGHCEILSSWVSNELSPQEFAVSTIRDVEDFLALRRIAIGGLAGSQGLQPFALPGNVRPRL
jgi:hypothetical protein